MSSEAPPSTGATTAGDVGTDEAPATPDAPWGTRVARWERRTEWPLAVTSLVFLTGYALPIMRPGLRPSLVTICDTLVLVTWAVFIVDYLARVAIAKRRRRYVRHHWFDLVVVFLPMLRPLRLLRVTAVLGVLTKVGVRGIRGRVVAYGVASSLLLVLTAALAITEAEFERPGPIQDFGDGLWWAFSTVTTVGYGDMYPVTTIGRIVATLLMIGGIALLGVVTATLASYLVDRVAATSDELSADAGMSKAEALAHEITTLRRELHALNAAVPGPVTPGPTGAATGTGAPAAPAAPEQRPDA